MSLVKCIGLAALLVFLTLIGLWWVSICFLFFLIIIFFQIYFMKRIKKGYFKFFYLLIFRSFCIVVIFVVFKNFIADSYSVSNNYMNDTLSKNDIILVDKLSYGPIIPKCIVEILSFFKIKQIRLSGLKKMKQGDIFMVEGSRSNNVFPLRCVGLPGDLLNISSGEIFVNGNSYEEPEAIKELYTFEVVNAKSFYNKTTSLGIKLKKGSNKRLGALISRYNIEILQDDIKCLNKELNGFLNTNRLFPKSLHQSLIYGWTLDNYGSILIPKKGMIIELDNYNFMIYKDVLREYEGLRFENDANVIYKNGKRVKSYTFKRNYYFLIGDNRKNSYDSRFFGFLPEDKIIGKVKCILFSYKEDNLQRKRIFKGV